MSPAASPRVLPGRSAMTTLNHGPGRRRPRRRIASGRGPRPAGAAPAPGSGPSWCPDPWPPRRRPGGRSRPRGYCARAMSYPVSGRAAYPTARTSPVGRMTTPLAAASPGPKSVMTRPPGPKVGSRAPNRCRGCVAVVPGQGEPAVARPGRDDLAVGLDGRRRRRSRCRRGSRSSPCRRGRRSCPARRRRCTGPGRSSPPEAPATTILPSAWRATP